MLTHKTKCRVIYGDTDAMGIAYYANYLRWFEMGRSELFRAMDLTYTVIEAKGIFLPVAEVFCKFLNPVRYDDILIIETSLDTRVRAGMKFDYRLLNEDETVSIANGYTQHAFMDQKGRVVRPPAFLRKVIAKNSDPG
jgi:acyl-CoA thioester hydrolase